MLKVGYLLPFYVAKNLPDQDSYLVGIPGSGLLAYLPKNQAYRQYVVGESGWGSISSVQDSRITLSQQSPHYIRRILEYVLQPVFKEQGMRIKHIARLPHIFCKVAIECSLKTSSDIYAACSKSMNGNMADFFTDRICFVKYDVNRVEYIKNALAPAPRDQILNVIYMQELQSATVYVGKEYVGIFMGKKGVNVATAARLLGIKIDLYGI